MGAGNHSMSVTDCRSWEVFLLTIKVLGPGCDNCKKVEDVARQLIAGCLSYWNASLGSQVVS